MVETSNYATIQHTARNFADLKYLFFNEFMNNVEVIKLEKARSIGPENKGVVQIKLLIEKEQYVEDIARMTNINLLILDCYYLCL